MLYSALLSEATTMAPDVSDELVEQIVDRVWREHGDRIHSLTDDIVGEAAAAAYVEDHARWTPEYRRALILKVRRRAEWRLFRERRRTD